MIVLNQKNDFVTFKVFAGFILLMPFTKPGYFIGQNQE